MPGREKFAWNYVRVYLVRAQDNVANQGAKSARLEMLLDTKLDGDKFPDER